eukprot:1323282-Alexandrium_andersonii.AAC.1
MGMLAWRQVGAPSRCRSRRQRAHLRVSGIATTGRSRNPLVEAGQARRLRRPDLHYEGVPTSAGRAIP